MKKVECPYCGYKMPIMLTDNADCTGVYVRCKGKNCKREFEVIVRNGNQCVKHKMFKNIMIAFKKLF